MNHTYRSVEHMEARVSRTSRAKIRQGWLGGTFWAHRAPLEMNLDEDSVTFAGWYDRPCTGRVSGATEHLGLNIFINHGLFLGTWVAISEAERERMKVSLRSKAKDRYLLAYGVAYDRRNVREALQFLSAKDPWWVTRCDLDLSTSTDAAVHASQVLFIGAPAAFVFIAPCSGEPNVAEEHRWFEEEAHG